MSNIFSSVQAFADSNPDKIAVIDGEQQLSYKSLCQKTEQLASALIVLKNLENKRVLSICPTPIHNVLLSLALSKLNGSFIPVNHALTVDQVKGFFHAVDAEIMVYDSASTINIDRFTIDTENLVDLQDLLTFVRNDSALVTPNVLPNEDFLITLSSGSTGDPKPIMISQKVKSQRASQTINLYELTSEDVVLNASPFYHSLGQRLTFVSLLSGSTLVLLTDFAPVRWIATVNRQGVTFTIAVSTHLYALKDIMLNSADKIVSLNTLVTSSAPIDKAFKQWLSHKVGCQFHEIYGATEIAIATNLSPSDFENKSGAVGLACDGVQLKLLDAEFNEVACGEIGEIACLTPLMFSGYYGKPHLTEQSFNKGYFLTGDLGSFDDEGYLTFVSRKKDIIISGGANVYPPDIEKVLLKHAELKSVSVIGVEDSLLGEVILAICEADESIEMDLRRSVSKELASYQRPLEYFFVEALPLTPSGKIDKIALRKFYNALDKDWSESLRLLMY